jgi:formylglycine-generating enzyme required for sulfatase activity
MVLRILFFALFPLSAWAQKCDCCHMRQAGLQKYEAKDFFNARNYWKEAQRLKDASQCPDLDSLLTSVEKIINPPPAPIADSILRSPVKHGKKSGLTMIPIKGGTFMMGSPENEPKRQLDECQHQVTVADFAIGQYEVTQADWKEVMGTERAYFKNCDECPIEVVSWVDAKNFIYAALFKYGRKYRLPTEAEWEYAARGGNKSQGFVFAGSDSIHLVAWYDQNAGGKHHEVGAKLANELGLYDMSGNVAEWCQDLCKAYPDCKNKPEKDYTRRSLRGGAWFDPQNVCRVANRYWGKDDLALFIYGFRLVLD